MPGKSAHSVVMEETSFPALHGTLVRVGGHLIQRTEECEARHKHKIPHTAPQKLACCTETRGLPVWLKGKREMLLNVTNDGSIDPVCALWLLCGLLGYVT